MADKRLFGTDGIRGVANEGILRPQPCLHLGEAIGIVAKENCFSPKVFLAHDGRRSAGMIGYSLSAGLLSQGFEIHDIGLLTTPALAWLTREHRAGLGVMISASHNPAHDNGIKLFGPGGRKLSDEIEKQIETRFAQASISHSEKIGQAHSDHQKQEDYLRYLTKKAFPKLRLRGMKIVLDTANGAASELGPELFRRLGAKLIAIESQPNGDNINHNCGALFPKRVAQETKRQRAHIGICLDGDGDRALFADERGQIVDGDGTMWILAKDLLKRRKLAKKTLVSTVMSNVALHRCLDEIGAKIEVVSVGDRQVVEALQNKKLSLGGEQSGHLVFGKDHFWIGDGLYSALRVVELLTRSKQTLSQLMQPFAAFPQVLLNVKVSSKPDWKENPRIRSAVEGVERKLGNSGRILLRYSGTEPLARVMVEGPDEKTIQEIAKEIGELVKQEIG